MQNEKHLKWLYSELPKLMEKGILSSDASNLLKEHYGPIDESPSYNLALIVAAVIGTALIGGGIILLFAFNWDNFSVTTKTVLSFIPLIIAQGIYGYTFFKKKDNRSWVEGSSLFLMLSLAACIALISQTYHIKGELYEFILVWMLLSIPLLYLMNPISCGVIYLIGISNYVLDRGSNELFYWVLLGGASYYLYKNLYQNKNENTKVMLGWIFIISIMFSFWPLYSKDFYDLDILIGGVFIAFFYFLGERIFQSYYFSSKPFQVMAVISAFIMLMILGFHWPESLPNFNSLSTLEHPLLFGINLIVFLVAFFFTLVFAIKDWKSKGEVNYFILALPFLILTGLIFSSNGNERIAVFMTNAFLLLFGVFYIRKGVFEKSISLVNLGLVFLSALIVARFFDSSWGFVGKGIVFILLGISFLFVNVVLSKRLKAENQ